jgi:hypothetical protein
MQIRKVATTLLAAASMFTAGCAFAAAGEAQFFQFNEIMSMKMMDKDKDGMVSKKEFMDMMSMAWDMNARKMAVKGDKMTPDQFKEVMMYLKAGG